MDIKIRRTPTGPLPPVIADPDELVSVMKRRKRVETVSDLHPLNICVPPPPIQVQLGKDHLDNNREEIRAAEDVLSNVYENLSLLDTRGAALANIGELLMRMLEWVDHLKISPESRDVIKADIALLVEYVDHIAATTTYRSVPILTTVKRIAPFPSDDASTASNQADIIFLVDKNEYMKKDADALARSIHVLHTALVNRGVDMLLGLQHFDRVSQPAGKLRSSLHDFVADLEAISNSFTGRTRNSLTAIRDAAIDQSFRAQSRKFFVILSDGEPDDDYGDLRDQTISTLKTLDAAFYAISVFGRLTGAPFSVFTELASSTGGRYINYEMFPFDNVLEQLALSIFDRMVEKGAHIFDSSERTIPIGPDTPDSISAKFPDFRAEALGIGNLVLETEEDCRAALSIISEALEAVCFDKNDKQILRDNIQRLLNHFDEIRAYRLDFRF